MKRHLKSVLFLFTKKRNLKASSYILHKPVNQLVLFVEWHCKDILFHCSQLLGFAIFLFIFIQYKFGKAHISTSVIIYKLIYTCVVFAHICWLFLFVFVDSCLYWSSCSYTRRCQLQRNLILRCDAALHQGGPSWHPLLFLYWGMQWWKLWRIF